MDTAGSTVDGCERGGGDVADVAGSAAEGGEAGAWAEVGGGVVDAVRPLSASKPQSAWWTVAESSERRVRTGLLVGSARLRHSSLAVKGLAGVGGTSLDK